MAKKKSRTDTERLEWLVEHHASFGTQGSMEVPVDEEFRPTGEPAEFRESRFARVPCKVMYEWHCYDGPTWRKAFDKAMDDKPCAEDDRGWCVKSSSIHSDVFENRWEAKYATMANHIADLSRRLAEQDAGYTNAVKAIRKRRTKLSDKRPSVPGADV